MTTGGQFDGLYVSGLRKTYPQPGSSLRRKRLTALDDVSFQAPAGAVYGLVGESGGGKTTVGRIIAGLTPADAGRVLYKGRDLLLLSRRQRRASSGEIQFIFQNSLEAFDPRQSAASALDETLRLRGCDERTLREKKVRAMLREVGLGLEQEALRPHELSGGQRQRLNIARALIGDPDVLICDEPVSALDVSIQAQILNLLRSLWRKRRLTMIFISHDLRVVRFMADTIGIMRRGRLIEEIEAEELPDGARHSYTKELLSAVL
jgi:ABC-type glutathione transport system ATPase component